MKIFKLKFIFVILFLCIFVQVQAQRNPLASQFYINPYIVNPAMAGAAQGLSLNGAFRKQKNAAPGAPVTQNLTAVYGFEKTGVGLNVNNDEEGLIRQTRFVGSYAYHLPLDGADQFLHFGISAGILSQHVDLNALNGNNNDALVGQYNARENYFDGDFGAAYNNERLMVQVAFVNLKHLFKKDVVKLTDVETYYTSVAYRISLTTGEEADLTPMLAYRGMDKVNNIWDAGLQLALANNQVYLSSIYHSTKSATFGLGVNYLRKYLISGMYNVNTSSIGENTNGSFEIGLGLKL